MNKSNKSCKIKQSSLRNI